MGRHAAGDAPEIDRIVDEAIVGVGAEIDALKIPHLRGVVLGGGYGRGEGGVLMSNNESRLSNDLDFYVVAEDDSSAADLAAIGVALEPISKQWTAKLGVDVDFCVAKTPWRLKHDEERVMVQELVHGYFDVAGLRGEELFKGVERRPPDAFPWMEAARLMMNRGVGLMLAHESTDSGFIARNINKCILGAGDARLIARGKYAWKALDRAAALGEPLYSAAVEWKFRPKKKPICDWETARTTWLSAYDEVSAAGRRCGAAGRSIYQAARWIARRRSLGDPRTFGQNCVVRVLARIERAVRGRLHLDASLRRDWEVFN